MSDLENLAAQSAAMINSPRILSISRKMDVQKLSNGSLSSSIDFITYDDKTQTSLCLRYVRSSDQKVYAEKFDNEYLVNSSPLGSDPVVIKTWLEFVGPIIPLDHECVIIFRRWNNLATFVLKEEVDSLPKQIADLKREHAAEIAEIHSKYTDDFRQTKSKNPRSEDGDVDLRELYSPGNGSPAASKKSKTSFSTPQASSEDDSDCDYLNSLLKTN